MQGDRLIVPSVSYEPAPCNNQLHSVVSAQAHCEAPWTSRSSYAQDSAGSRE